jgi:hypothetical protein
MFAESDAVAAQKLRGRRFGNVSGFAHRRIVMASLHDGYLPNGQLCGPCGCGTIVRILGVVVAVDLMLRGESFLVVILRGTEE